MNRQIGKARAADNALLDRMRETVRSFNPTASEREVEARLRFYYGEDYDLLFPSRARAFFGNGNESESG